jgi:hypothetical protein
VSPGISGMLATSVDRFCELVVVPRALGMGSYRFSVWTFDQLECGNVGAFQPRLQYGPADFTGYVTGMRH